MIYRIQNTEGKELDRCDWPGHRWLQAAQLGDYCEDHDYDIVRAKPNMNFTEITITVRSINN